MLSQRGMVNLCHSTGRNGDRRAHRQCHADQRHRCRAVFARGCAARGADLQFLDPMRAFRCSAASGRAGPARRATTRSPGAMRGRQAGSASTSSRTARSPTSSSRAAAAAACRRREAPSVPIASAWRWPGHSSVLAAKAGFRLPINSYALQACVSEPVKPILDTVVLSPGCGVYVSQSDKGEIVIGGGLDRIPSYAQRGNLPTLETVIAGAAGDVPDLRPAEADAAMGRHRRRRAGLLADHRRIAAAQAVTSIAAGARAASRPSPPAARCWRTCWRPASTTTSADRSTSTASPADG